LLAEVVFVFNELVFAPIVEAADAAMGQRAEYVTLNEGTHISETVKTLSRLLISEGRHHIKKRDVFREFTKQFGVFD
jgi:pyruvate kinase